jgi:hypothetical protein
MLFPPLTASSYSYRVRRLGLAPSKDGVLRQSALPSSPRGGGSAGREGAGRRRRERALHRPPHVQVWSEPRVLQTVTFESFWPWVSANAEEGAAPALPSWSSGRLRLVKEGDSRTSPSSASTWTSRTRGLPWPDSSRETLGCGMCTTGGSCRALITSPSSEDTAEHALAAHV